MKESSKVFKLVIFGNSLKIVRPTISVIRLRSFSYLRLGFAAKRVSRVRFGWIPCKLIERDKRFGDPELIALTM